MGDISPVGRTWQILESTALGAGGAPGSGGSLELDTTRQKMVEKCQ